MHVLLHGNQIPARGGVSLQLLGRLNAVLRMDPDEVERVYFLAQDAYPDGTRACEFVSEALVRSGFRSEQLLIDPVAADTRTEVFEFVRRRAQAGHRGSVRAVTSFYHAPRCRHLFAQAGVCAEVVKVTTCHPTDLICEPAKIVLDCTSLGQRMKRIIRPQHVHSAAS